METVKVASLGQITDALFNVGGQYRLNILKNYLKYGINSQVIFWCNV
jgi:hypothetical protein